MEEKQFPKGILYKIDSEHYYYVSAKTWNDKTYYNVNIQQTNADGTKTEFKRQLRFVKCEPPHNGDRIRIISGFESNYASTRDPYNCITCICVTEWELEQVAKDNISEAYNQFNSNNTIEDITITDDMIPF